MVKENSGTPSANGDHSKKLAVFKEKAGLPKWKELNNELDEGFAKSVEKKIDLMHKYATANKILMEVASAADWRIMNIMQQTVDLQGKLWELEEKLRADHINPLEDDSYMRAREQLQKDMQFIHKHGLDQAKFQADLAKAQSRMDDDNIFTVNTNAEQ